MFGKTERRRAGKRRVPQERKAGKHSAIRRVKEWNDMQKRRNGEIPKHVRVHLRIF